MALAVYGVFFIFRGVTAPASLKRRAAGKYQIRRAHFPGRNCPGLIEARPELISQRFYGTFSGA